MAAQVHQIMQQAVSEAQTSASQVSVTVPPLPKPQPCPPNTSPCAADPTSSSPQAEHHEEASDPVAAVEALFSIDALDPVKKAKILAALPK